LSQRAQGPCVPRRRAITGTFKIRIVQPDQPARETDMKRTAGADVNRSFLLAYAGFVAAEKQPFP